MKIVLTPDWFLGSDVLIEIFSFIILAFFFLFSWKSYKLSRNKKALYLGIGFLLIALAELSTIFTKLVLYYDTTFTQTIGYMIITYNVVKSIDVFYYIGFFFHKLLTLAGLYIIYRLPLKKKSFGDVLIAACFIIIASVFSLGTYYLFHITAIVLLLLIIMSYYPVYKKNRLVNTGLLLIAFGMQALSQIIFIFSKVGFLYVFGQVIQLVSYIILLIIIIRIIKHGKKENQDKNNFRYAGNNTRKKR